MHFLPHKNRIIIIYVNLILQVIYSIYCIHLSTHLNRLTIGVFVCKCECNSTIINKQTGALKATLSSCCVFVTEWIFAQCPTVSIIQIAFWMHRFQFDSELSNSKRITNIDLLFAKIKKREKQINSVWTESAGIGHIYKNSRHDLNEADLKSECNFA